MPKMKTHSSSKKRFKVTATGKVRAQSAFTRHRLRNRPMDMKRKARGMMTLCDADAKVIKDNYLPYQRR